jgi:hypothetical protein
MHRSTLSGSNHNLGFFPPQETPAQSTLTSRGNSDEELEEEAGEMHSSGGRRATVRNSMPVTNFDYLGVTGGSDNILGMNSLSSINSLFADEDEFPVPTHHRHTASIDNTVLRAETTNEDGFPILVRRPTDSTNSLLGAPGLPGGAPTVSGRFPSYRRHRQGQQSLPMNTLRRDDEMGFGHARAASIFDPPTKDHGHRSSIDLSNTPLSNRSSLHMNPPALRPTMSTNDVPTLNNSAAAGLTHAEQHLQNHNVTTGRFPHRRNLSSGRIITDPSGLSSSSNMMLPSLNTTAGALPTSSNLFSSPVSATMPNATANLNGGLLNNQIPLYAGLYNVQPSNLGLPAQNLTFATSQLPYAVSYMNSTTSSFQAGRIRDSQQAVIAQRRLQNEDTEKGAENGYYANMELDALVGKIFETSKDQHGARFLQKKIDEDTTTNLAIVFNEVKEHVVELMKDPFGNYLCQRLLEHGTDEQRTTLLHNCAPSMVEIATNQHGTRALQRLIEFSESPEQVQVIVESLRADVVNLIEDLNGNHVIQKCLNHLRAEDAQFIFDAVGANAFKVGIHRHGCCVLQRCIDHASGPQKDRLIAQVIESAYDLSQDQYGNYVIQYIRKCFHKLINHLTLSSGSCYSNHYRSSGTDIRGPCRRALQAKV